MSKTKKAIDHILCEPWLITQAALEQIILIAERKTDVEAVEAKLGKPLEHTRTVTIRDGVAIVPVVGPIFRYANLFTRMSGATSLEDLALDFNAALDDPAVSSIVLEIDSPGGHAAGISEFADMVRASSKRVVAHTSSTAASAAYWIAAAAHELVISDTAQLGSIGVISGYRKDDDEGVVEFISSQSPKKRLDMDEDDDRAAMQQTMDHMADVFVDKVAGFRGVSRETVLADFGQGWVLVGEHAVAAGMADRLGSLESVIAGLSGNAIGAYNMPKANQPDDKPVMSLETLKSDHADIYQAAFNEGVEQGKSDECERIKSVESAALPGHEQLIAELKFDGQTTGADAALRIVQAEKENRSKGLSSFREEAPGAVTQPASDDVSTSSTSSEESSGDDEVIKAKWDKSADLRSEFGGDFEAFSAYEKAAANGQIKVLKTGKN